jgi:hypothetical protein
LVVDPCLGRQTILSEHHLSRDFVFYMHVFLQRSIKKWPSPDRCLKVDRDLRARCQFYAAAPPFI